MPINAIFAPGQTEITVNGLHQWDYGQKLYIYSSELPAAAVEVHFACVGMAEAIVRSCTVTSGKAEVTIPDKCLEQNSPITAWVFEIDDTTGTTTKKITLPVESRTRPSVGEDIPEDVVDKYTELITAANTAVEGLSNGTIKAKNAEQAEKATVAMYASDDTSKGTIDYRLGIISSKDQVTYASTAGHASTADSATTAGHASTADSATTAESASKIASSFTKYTMSSNTLAITLEANKTYLIRFQDSDYNNHTVVLCTGEYINSDSHYSTLSSCYFDPGTSYPGVVLWYKAIYSKGSLKFSASTDIVATDIRPYGGKVYIREL